MKQKVVFKAEPGKTYGAPETKQEKGLSVISADTIYAVVTQPKAALEYLTFQKELKIKYTRERALSILASCMVYAPSEIDRYFNVEVQEPYDYQVANFAKELVSHITARLDADGEIDSETIEEMKKKIYSEKTYTIPLNVIYNELKDNQDYINYLMNYNDKITVTRSDMDLIKSAIQSFVPRQVSDVPKVLKSHAGWEANAVLTGTYRSAGGKIFELATTVPYYFTSRDGSIFKYIVYTDTIFNKKLSFESLRESFFHVDLGLALFITTQLNQVHGKLSVTVEFVDSLGNRLTTSLKPESVQELMKEALELLNKAVAIAERRSVSVQVLLDSRVAEGTLMI